MSGVSDEEFDTFEEFMTVEVDSSAKIGESETRKYESLATDDEVMVDEIFEEVAGLETDVKKEASEVLDKTVVEASSAKIGEHETRKDELLLATDDEIVVEAWFGDLVDAEELLDFNCEGEL